MRLLRVCRRFIVKTIERPELKCMLQILPSYMARFSGGALGGQSSTLLGLIVGLCEAGLTHTILTKKCVVGGEAHKRICADQLSHRGPTLPPAHPHTGHVYVTYASPPLT